MHTIAPQSTLDHARASFESGDYTLPLSVYSDEALFELERKRIFGRTWVFLAHETELPQPGDYVVRNVVDSPYIVVRGEDGVVRVFLDACRHRGMQVCRAELGNTSHFRCPYHGWTYKNDGQLVGVPFDKMAYGPEGFDRGNWGLSEMPQVAIRNGFVFGNLDPDAPSLDEYMGDYGWYFDLYSRRTEGGIEVVGLPQRWVLHANWKVLAENFMGDAYHSPTSHKSVVEIGLSGVAKDRSKQSAIHYNANGIGGGGLMRTEPSYEGYSPEVQAAMRAWLDPAHREVTDDRGFMPVSGLMFPTLAFLCVSAVVESGGDAVPFLTIRAMRPLNAGSIEMISWFAVDREASPEFRDKSMRAYSASFGSAGMFEQDDAENWASVTRAARGIGAADHRINVRMGLDSAGEPIVPPLGDWPGPGTAYPVPFAEHNARVFWSTWLRYMTAGEDA